MSDLETLREEALALAGYDDLTIGLPLFVLLGEAVDLAKFCDRYWATQLDGRKVVRPGLDSVGGAAKPVKVTERTAARLLALQRAAVEANTAYQLSVTATTAAPVERAQALLAELESVLEFLFDDGQTDDRDAQLARLDGAHPDPHSIDALALALEDYAALAQEHRAALDGLGGFDVADIDEAKEIAKQLRDRPANPQPPSASTRDALRLRNKVVGLLVREMTAVRSAARFVFRHQPQIVREATSSYERRRRADAARRSKAAAASPAL